MGRKRTGKRQYLLFYFIACLIMTTGMTACAHFEGPRQAENPISQARTLMKNEKYEAALREIEEILRSDQENQADQALYLMGVIYAHPKNPVASLDRSTENFQILIKKYPHSDLKQEAVAWVSKLRKIRTMEKEILDLKDQIDKLKKIDLGIEEKKRRKLPH